MTITYTTIKRTVEGNSRAVYGKAVTTSSEGTLYVNTGLRICYNFTPFYNQSGDARVTYPTSFPARVDQSGYITVVKRSANDTLYYRAIGIY